MKTFLPPNKQNSNSDLALSGDPGTPFKSNDCRGPVRCQAKRVSGQEM